MLRLGVLGGTFNPVHWGHLLMAEAAIGQFKLDRVLWIPTYHPPHKPATELADAADRLEMIRLAIAPHPAFELSTIELERRGSSYAIDTFADLQAIYPDSEWNWIVGLDAFQSLPRWHARQQLIPKCRWLVAPRFSLADVTLEPLLENSLSSEVAPSASRSLAELLRIEAQQRCQHVEAQLAQQSIAVCWQPLELPLVEVSSTLIRQYCRDRRSIRALTPDPVSDYIAARRLYVSGNGG